MMGDVRGPQAYRNAWRHRLSPAVEAKAQATDGMELDLLLVRKLFDSGAEHETGVIWSTVMPGMSATTAQARFWRLTKRVAYHVGSLGFSEVVDRLLLLLEKADAERKRKAQEAEEEDAAFNERVARRVESLANRIQAA